MLGEGNDAVICSVQWGAWPLSWHQQAHAAAVQEGQSRLVLHQLLCHWPVGLETRDVGADVGVILHRGTVLGLRVTSSSLLQALQKWQGREPTVSPVPHAGPRPVPLCSLL